MKYGRLLTGIVVCGFGLTGCSTDHDLGADDEVTGKAESALTCSEQATTLDSLVTEMRTLTTAGCNLKANRDRYEYLLYSFVVLQSAHSKQCNPIFYPSQKRMDMVKATATGACMQKWCGDVSAAELGYNTQLNTLTCQAGLQLDTYASLMNAKEDWCQDLGNTGEWPRGAPPKAPSVYVLQFGLDYGGIGRANACALTSSRCRADNAACHASKDCHADLKNVPGVQSLLAAIEAVQCAPSSEATSYDSMLANDLNDFAADLQQCVANGYFSSAEQAQVQAFNTQKDETTAECNETKACVALLSEVDQIVQSQVTPIVAAKCAGNPQISNWQTATTTLGDKTTMLGACLTNGHLKAAEETKWLQIKATLQNASSLCTQSSECHAKLVKLASDYQTITSIYAGGCLAPTETQYKSALNDFETNDIVSGGACWQFMDATDQQNLTTYQTGVKNSVCQYCGLAELKCCDGQCNAGLKCHPELGPEGRCKPCGNVGYECCDKGDPCFSGGKCDGGFCVSCGQQGISCCDKGDCPGSSTLACSQNTCVKCGDPGGPCCGPSGNKTCNGNAECINDTYCQACGTVGKSCCGASGCYDGSECNGGNCETKKGGKNEPCNSGYPQCDFPDLTCQSGICTCGQHGGNCCGAIGCDQDPQGAQTYECISNTCLPVGNLGQLCKVGGECSSTGLTCLNDVCQAK